MEGPMKSLVGVGALVLLLSTASVQAQEAQATEEDQDQAQVQPPIRRVMDPYEIADVFYRASQGEPTGLLQYRMQSQYPIASYYRLSNGRPIGYRRLYSTRPTGYAAPVWGRQVFLFAPTFLAPVGPLAGTVFDPN
jgi:hypothetical protein